MSDRIDAMLPELDRHLARLMEQPDLPAQEVLAAYRTMMIGMRLSVQDGVILLQHSEQFDLRLTLDLGDDRAGT